MLWASRVTRDRLLGGRYRYRNLGFSSKTLGPGSLLLYPTICAIPVPSLAVFTRAPTPPDV